jgi:membrane associated rhomboid family serine protease
MRFDPPDPAYSDSPRVRANFRLAVELVLGFTGLLWLAWLASYALGVSPGVFALKPRQLDGLPGIALAPLLHSGLEHLAANTLPLVVLGITALHLYPRASLRALPFLYFGPGVAVWIAGRDASHIGASGLVYGLIAFVFVSGWLRGDRRALAASMIVAFLYGSAVWGVLPLQERVSWETHLAGAFIGVLAAFALRKFDHVPKRRFDWENEGVVDLEPEDARPPPAPDYADEPSPSSSVVPVAPLGGTPVWIFDGRRYRQIGVRPDSPRDD